MGGEKNTFVTTSWNVYRFHQRLKNVAADQSGILARKCRGIVQNEEPFENVQAIITFKEEPDNRQRGSARLRVI